MILIDTAFILGSDVYVIWRRTANLVHFDLGLFLGSFIPLVLLFYW